MRIAIVCSDASERLGGEALIPLQLFRVYRKQGIECYLFTHERVKDELLNLFEAQDHRYLVFAPDSRLQKMICRLGHCLPEKLREMFAFGAIRLITERWQRRTLKTYVDEGEFDVVHQPVPISPRMPTLIFGVGVPVMIGPLNGDINYPPAFRDRQSLVVRLIVWFGRCVSELLNYLLPGKRKSSCILVCNERTRRSLPFAARRVATRTSFDNGVVQSVWENVRRTEREKVARFVFVGRLVVVKSVDLLLEALRLMPHRVSLTVIGDGPERERLEHMAADIERHDIEFVGFLSHQEIVGHFQNARALVMPSLAEAGGTNVIEAMASGLPVIGSDWGGIADYLTVETGILVKPSSRAGFVEGLAAAMTKLIEDPKLAEEMGRQARERALHEYSWEKKGRDCAVILQGLIDEAAMVKKMG
jgi:glycosyltransferase involved in cell wall biosynthesis